MILFSRNVPSRLAAARRIMTVGASLAMLGMLPAAASAQTWNGPLRGTSEVPATSSPATGFVTMSLSGNFLSLSLSWNGLIGGPAAAGHIHCCAPVGSNVGVAVGFVGLTPGASGTYSNVFDLTNLSTYTSTYVTNFGGGTAAGAQSALIAGLNSGTAYVNLHNATYSGGEIRANVVVTPEPASMAMLAVGLLALGTAARMKRRVS